jgi:DNA topoisomerase-2
MSARKQTYVKKDQISHVLDRPDMYVGSIRARDMEEFVVVDDEYHISRQTIKYSPAALRIFIEPLSNVIDNVARSKKAKKPVTKICIDIDRKTGETTFWNDGLVIPIELHEEEGCYNHTLIFGHLLTSSNYDDEEERLDISGRNGVGVKLTNVYSTQFMVRGFDPDVGKTFKQTWTNNMKNAGEPVVRNSKLKKGVTIIRYTPDFKHLKMKGGYTDDIIGLYKKYIMDMAMITKVDVYFNGELVPVKSLVDYSKLYTVGDSNETLYIKTKDCEVVLTPSSEYECISFANGVCTPLGGTHTDAWSETLFRPVVDKFNKPKKPQINIKDVRNCFRLFVVASVVNPKFESQNKCKLEEPTIVAPFKKTYLNKISKWSVMARLEDIIRSKEFVALKKVERKRRGYTKIEGLDAANNEGGKNGHLCTLIIVEGLSAKTYAVSGIEVGVGGLSGRDWFGIYPLRGKVLNCRNNTPAVIAKNKVVGDIIKALGVRTGLDYTVEKNYRTLRYGKIMILTDADVDGIHISGLVQNMFHSLFPSLLEREDPFITAMQTPIVRLTLSKKNQKLFYDERQYRRYVAAYQKKYPNKKLTHKYYKGLGTSDEATVQETFGVKMLELVSDEKTHESMVRIFHTKYADARKDWLAKYDPNDIRLVWNGEKEETLRLTMTDFLNTEMIKFSLDDCGRSIPSLMDGLKESQRKILYVALLRNLRYSGKTIKVAQFGASVAEKSGYHHGEQNLYDTLIKMAASFVGSNNIPLFFRDGQFGTRLAGGKDAASPRYIFTKLEMLTRIIFNPDDDELLKRNEDDGDVVEPVQYMPIIPMVLVNGCTTAIGTGWSSTIPCYNPLDLVNAIKVWLDNDGEVIEKEGNTVVSILPEMVPWYRGFTGTIEANNGKFVSRGRVTPGKGSKVVVDELPIGMWTNKFTGKLDGWKEEKSIRDYKNYCTPKEVNFTITESEDGFICNEKNLGLSSNINLTNMVMFTEDGSIKRFGTVEEIIDQFCTVRYDYYVLRKQNNLKKLEANITLLGNKKRFLEEVLKGKIKLFTKQGSKKVARSTEDLVNELEEREYDKILKKENTEDDEDSKDHGYNYLLGMQIRSITAEKINKLKNDLASVIERRDELAGTEEKDLWLDDLDKFVTEYTKWLKIIAKEVVKKRRGTRKK